MKKFAYAIALASLFALYACNSEDNYSMETEEPVTRGLADNYKEPLFNYAEEIKSNPENFRLIFQDDEPNEVVWNPNLRSFKTNELLQISRLTNTTCRLTSYVPKKLENVVIKAKLFDEDEYFELLKIDSIPAFAQFEFTPAFIHERTIYKTENGIYTSIKLASIPSAMSFKIESTDSLWNMLSRIKVSWHVDYNEHGWGGNWKDINVLYAREWVVMITNYAYIVSSPEWEYLVNNWKEVTGADLYSDVASKTVLNYTDFFNRARANRSVTLGLTTLGGGLGGGSVVGVDHWNFYSHYRSQGYLAIAHEFGHWFGYGHNSSICSNYGHSDYASVIMYLHDYMWRRDMVPYPDRDMLGFVKYKDTPLFLHPGVADNLYNYKVGANYITNWFTTHPIE